MPVLEDLPREEKVRRGNVLLKTRPRDVEETLLQLINDDDQVVAAAAIDVVRQQQMWSLADDIEHVLAHRDVRDWYVFEAASWALAEQRMPAERRRELWLEPLPAAELAGRLRTLPLFASVSVDELFRIASAAAAGAPRAGHASCCRRAPCPTTHAPAARRTGRCVQPRRRRRTRSSRRPRWASTKRCRDSRCARRCAPASVAVTLALSVDELRTLLADNTDLVTRAVRDAADARPGAAAPGPPDVPPAPSSPRSPRAACRRSRRCSRSSECRSSAARRSTRWAALAAVVPHRDDDCRRGLFAESAPPALWLILSGEL